MPACWATPALHSLDSSHVGALLWQWPTAKAVLSSDPVGDGPSPTAADVDAAIELTNRVERLAVAALFGAAAAVRSRPIRRFLQLDQSAWLV
ncbi:MAG: hypothetical protein ACI88C_002991 [Acidimicrobiales bacterium]|jgi:hypothetical protein